MSEDTRIGVLLLGHPLLRPNFLKDEPLFHRFFEDLSREGITLIPGPPPGFPVDLWREYWRFSLQWVPFSLDEWGRWEHLWRRHPEQERRYWSLPEVIRFALQLSDERIISGILIVTLPRAEEYADIEGLEDVATRIPRDPRLLRISLSPQDTEARPRIPDTWSLNYPADRSQILEILTSLRRVDQESFDHEGALLSSAPPSASRPSASRPSAAPPSAAQPSEAPPSSAPLPSAAPPSAPLPLGKPPRSAGYPLPEMSPRQYPPVVRRSPPAKESRSREGPLITKEVHIGAAVPGTVRPGEDFAARFAAYTKRYKEEVSRIVTQEAPSAQPRLDLETCRWRRGAKVTVRLDAHNVEVSNPVQTFKWNGAWCVLRFDAKAAADTDANTLILRFDVAVEGLPILAIRPEIAVSRKQEETEVTPRVTVIERASPKSAFASYAMKDRRDVLGRVRSLQIFTGIDVFLDCLSARPGDEWKAKLKAEIAQRDIFWLFWSRNAIASEWVDWEWKEALKEKTISGIQPHPLEPAELAPPPPELSSLQFGAMYEWYVSQLRESPMKRVFRPLLHKAVSWIRPSRTA